MPNLLIRGLTPGQNYAIQVRATNGSHYSLWSPKFPILATVDTSTPNAPTGLTWVVSGTAFSADWTAPTTNTDSSPLTDLKDYQITLYSPAAPSTTVVYYTTGTHFDFTFEQNVNAFHTPRATVNIEVRARDTSNHISAAATASATNDPPSNVTGATATGVFEAIIVSWNANPETDIQYYEVYMGTSAGFTPGPSNLVFQGLTTRTTIDTGTDYSTRYFKIRAVDVFNSPSPGYATCSATPLSSFGTDATAPNPPTSFVVSTYGVDSGDPTGTTGQITVTWVAPTTNVDSTPLTDLAGYDIRYSQTGSSPFQVIPVPSDQTMAQITGLVLGQSYYIDIRAADFTNNYSTWVNCSPYPRSLPNDTTAPSQPSAPTVNINSAGTLIQVVHNLLKQAGGNLEPDTHHLDVFASTTTGFTPSTANKIGTMDIIPPPVSGTPITAIQDFTIIPTAGTTTQNWFVKVEAVDNAGNASTPSNQTTAAVGLLTGVAIADATITDAKIGTLSANKITAGTGIINALDVKNTLTIQTGGTMQSSNWVSGSSGWRLTDTTLELNGGTISAAAIQLQDSQNIALPEYADFEFFPGYYSGKLTTTNATAAVTLVGPTNSKYGNYVLNFTWSTSSANKSVNLTDAVPTYVQPVEPGEIYIVSAWVYNNVGSAVNIRMGGRLSTGSATTITGTQSIPSTTWTRIYGLFTVPVGVSRMYLYFENLTSGQNTGNFYIDGIQIERQISSLATPSPWRPPGTTNINGGQIVTGTIQSSTNVTVNGTPQPAWSVNLTGNAQFGNVDVRGKLYVGGNVNIDPDAGQSAVLSGNYVANSAGWKIDSSGDAEFNSAKIRGQVPSGAALTVNGQIVAGTAANNQGRIIIDPSTGLQLIYRDGTGADTTNVYLNNVTGQGFFEGSIQSNDYVQAAKGWFFGTDPTDSTVVSQVENLFVSGDASDLTNPGRVSADQIDAGSNLTLNGVNILDYIAGGGTAGKLISRYTLGSGSEVNSAQITTTETIIYEVSVDMDADNTHLIMASGMFSSNGAVDGDVFEMRLRYTTDGTKPINTSTIMDGSEIRVQQSQVGVSWRIMTTHNPSGSGAVTYRIGLALVRQNGTGAAQVKLDDANTRSEIAVYVVDSDGTSDVGTLKQRSFASGSDPDPTGTPTPVKTHTVSYTADWTKSYEGGTSPTSSRTGGDGGKLYQGYYDGTHGNQRSLWGLNTSNLNDLDARLSGATVKKVTLTFKVAHTYYNSGASIRISSHNYGSGSAPSTWDQTRVNVEEDHKTSAQSGGTYTLDITSWAATRLKSGAIRGFGFGPGLASTDHLYYAYMYGTPKITITYAK